LNKIYSRYTVDESFFKKEYISAIIGSRGAGYAYLPQKTGPFKNRESELIIHLVCDA